MHEKWRPGFSTSASPQEVYRSSICGERVLFNVVHKQHPDEAVELQVGLPSTRAKLARKRSMPPSMTEDLTNQLVVDSRRC
eukprot:5909602-Amphidinium_carterae.1